MAVRGLTAADVLRVWETGGALHPIDRALLLCACAAPELDRASLATLALGDRDALLLALHARTFGERIDATLECERCKAGLEVCVTAASLRVESSQVETTHQLAGIELVLRKLDSRDLAAIVHVDDPVAARRMLVARAVVRATGALSEADEARIAEWLAELDPQADLVFDLTCSECHHQFRAPFDIASFVWSEVSLEARRLLQEVAALAHAFKWSERDILAMSRQRRQRYLELAEA